MEGNIYFIYKYEWDDGSVYIGQSHIGAYRYGYISCYRNSPLVYRKMVKYPEFSKEILRDGLTSEEVDDFEKYYIKMYNSYRENNKKGLNLTLGGVGKIGCVASNSTRKKIGAVSAKRTGSNHPFYGKTLSEEHRHKLSESHKGQKQGNENHNYGKFGGSHPKSKKIICIETGEIYPSSKELSEKLGCHRDSIKNVCLGKKQTLRGLHFKYLEDPNGR